ncbi:helix-turn-helix domain-containing protein [Saccharibacillus sacchari]|uniref:Helix-turn-helix domain-containing protein n=1 Tax=Saccharibacillus sacchari TaxID=456493 RepID=A0ACC6PAB0_9BACL
MIYPLKERLNAPLEQQEARRPTGTDRRILDAAKEVFARYGFQGAKTLEIARTAGVSEKTLFQHFKNKEQLFAEAIHPTLLDILDPLVKISCEESHEGASSDNRIAAAHEEVMSTPQMPGTLKERMHAVALERVHFARENPDMLKLTLQELLIRDEYRDAVTGLWMDQLAPIISASIEAGVETGEIRDLPIPTVMRVIVPVLSAYATIRSLLAPEGDWNDEREVDLMLDILFNGLIPRKSDLTDTP